MIIIIIIIIIKEMTINFEARLTKVHQIASNSDFDLFTGNSSVSSMTDNIG